MPVLTPEQHQRWEEDGSVLESASPFLDLTKLRYLLIPGFFTAQETSEMYNEATRLTESFDVAQHPLVSRPSPTRAGSTLTASRSPLRPGRMVTSVTTTFSIRTTRFVTFSSPMQWSQRRPTSLPVCAFLPRDR